MIPPFTTSGNSQPWEWQDIATAPKDGRRVKLLIPYDRSIFSEEECIDEGSWDAEAYWPGVKGHHPPETGCWRFDGDDGPFDIAPTHWMPLEAPEPTP